MPINVTRSSLPDFDEYAEEIRDLWQSRWLTNMGEKHNRLQKALEEYLSVEHVSLFTNGHLALEAALSALELTGEVITTPFTFASTTQAIVRCGLTPVFCDIEPEHYTMDAARIEPLITEKTSAIVPVHVYGSVCQVEQIEKLAAKYGLKVIYDAAHAFGVRVGEKGIGSFGDASMFSFHATKVFNTIEGGCVAYREERLTERLQQQKNFGLQGEDCPVIAGNAKMNEFQAAMGLCNLRHVEEEIAKRKRAVECYRERLEGVTGLKLWQEQPGVAHNYAYFPVLIEKERFGIDRDEAAERLAGQEIFARKYFYPLTNSFSCYRGKFTPGHTPVAEYTARNILALPLYAGLEEQDVDGVCRALLSK